MLRRKDISTKIAEKLNVPVAAAERFSEMFLNEIVEAVKAGETINFTGFGSFSASERSARMARNPSTGEEIHVEACLAPRFKAGQSFKDALKDVDKAAKAKKSKANEGGAAKTKPKASSKKG